MLVVGGYLFKSAHSGQRSYYDQPGERWSRWGPFTLICLAVPLIMADLTRHLLQDNGLWPECGNNPHYSRINASDPFPSSCFWSSSQYRCQHTCCVPVWISDPNATGAYTWEPKQTCFFPDSLPGMPDSKAKQFGTMRDGGSVYFPPGFNRALQPYTVFEAPLVLYDDSTRNPATDGGGGKTSAECPLGVNPITGYCLLELAAGQSCGCDSCLPDSNENMLHLSPMGWIFTILFTYSGFVLLAVAVMWNASIIEKLKGLKDKWRQLRGRAAVSSTH